MPPRNQARTSVEIEVEMKKLAGSFILEVARRNWLNWQDVYEHKGAIATNPLLAYEGRFASFLTEYSVRRTIEKGRHDKLRRKLRNSSRFLRAIEDGTGNALDRLARDLGPGFGSKKNAIVSVLSKVAAFVRPETFVAWDQFGRKGLKLVLGLAVSPQFDCYSGYLAAFNTVWKNSRAQIGHYVARQGVHNSMELEDRFLRRVLDVYLMKRGSRWSRRTTGGSRRRTA